MTKIEKDAGFYRDDLADDRNFRPMTIALIVIVVVWALVYLVGGATHSLSTSDGAQLDSSTSATSVADY